MESTWTIAELATTATVVLSGEPMRVNGRVRDMPNERLIRWYTTIGLVDPPLARRGRVALYGRRHLLQLVAVKRRQAAGRTLAQIQAELSGATDDSLQEIAALPHLPSEPPGAPDQPGTSGAADTADRSDASDPPGSGKESAAPRPQGRFWARSPSFGPTATGGPTAAHEPMATGPAPSPAFVHGVRLAPGVTLLLDDLNGDAPAPPLGPEDLAAIEAAARPLLDALDRRGLLPAPARTTRPADPDHTDSNHIDSNRTDHTDTGHPS